jgi:hypothetical protein
MEIIDHFRGIVEYTYLNLMKENRRMSTCNWLDLQTPGSQPFMLKKSPITASPHVELEKLHVGGSP